MLLRRTDTDATSAARDVGGQLHRNSQIADSQRPLTCMFYFFASQMKRNIQPADRDLVQRGRLPDEPTHKLDTMVARLRMQAAFSPHVTKFETYPVEIPDPAPTWLKREARPSPEEIHDTVMLMKFRNKRAREEWIATKEWQEFMTKTEGEQVFRRMPHVRCASSLRGLMDPVDILTA
ncbi:uncharacterized protein PV06_09461 [Exophiala oligosperma]|uniref:Uncharacterized protein n=2 Tax=Chaetothyriales TaxID=34395 RepID=A0A0D2D803_9EURO|nr:uncharacterized protein PV06_09461 [Exophiala oligosperma]KAJ9637580.1 hypothetical protein H2204_004729 [Knufia peltigerae]KIW38505.1 hypothetical protein PV06_09461 [Exophiala oligosperma]